MSAIRTTLPRPCMPAMVMPPWRHPNGRWRKPCCNRPGRDKPGSPPPWTGTASALAARLYAPPAAPQDCL